MTDTSPRPELADHLFAYDAVKDEYVFRDDGTGTQAVLTIAPEGANFPGRVGLDLREIAGSNRDPDFDECSFSIAADQVGEVIDALRDSVARHADVPASFLSEQEKIAAAISMLAFASEVDGGIHSFEAGHDGDGWTEPLSDHYSCGCGDGSSDAWGLSWMQSDPEHTGRPDPTTMLLAWAAHVDTASTNAEIAF